MPARGNEPKATTAIPIFSIPCETHGGGRPPFSTAPHFSGSCSSSDMILLNPVRCYQWGGASDPKTDARIARR